MRIGRDIWVVTLLITVCAITEGISAAQSDTVRNRLLDMYWTKPRLIPKIGASIQERAILELGIQWHNIYRHPLSLASKGPYISVDLIKDNTNYVIGPKLGYEFTAGVFGTAIDVTYFYDKDYNSEGNDRRAWVATPKAGLTVLGFLNFFYGYQIPISDQRITSLSRHRLSVVFNLNKDYFNIKNAPRKN